MKIVADKNIPFLKGVAEKFGNVNYLAGSEFSEATIKDADTLIVRTVTHFDKNLLEGSSVKLICSATIGYDHIDTEYCDNHNIIWKNAPGCNSGSVQQYIASVLITMAQQKNFSLKDKTIGIVGIGNVGKKVSSICSLLGMRVLQNDPPRKDSENIPDFVDLDVLMKEADIITFHTPLTKEGIYKTYHLADTEFFNSLEKKPIIINSARGAIIDTIAIKKAIKENQISGAIIDCWEKEPNIDLEYMQMVNIATPHIAGYSADGKANATRMSLTSVANFWNLDKAPIDKIVVPEIENNIIDYSNLRHNKLENAILKTYNPLEDCKRLLDSPSDFSILRSNYPLRREYGAYKIINVDNDVDREIFIRLGFRLL